MKWRPELANCWTKTEHLRETEKTLLWWQKKTLELHLVTLNKKILKFEIIT